MYLLAVGLNHKTAPVEVREKLSFPDPTIEKALSELRAISGIAGCAILSTCNRTEVYAAAYDVEKGLGKVREFLAQKAGIDVSTVNDYLYTHTLYDAIHHLFRVASGLDSMVLGETQILGQVRTAYQNACDYGVTNGVLNTFFQQAIAIGKRVRTETGIDRCAVSISYAAVELGKQILGTLEGRSIMIIGAGKMSELTAKHLVCNGVTGVTVANRSFHKAEAMAEQFGGRAVPLENLFEAMAGADIVVSCTSATEYIIRPENIKPVMERRAGKGIFIIDIAVPRDVDPNVAEIEGITLYDIDDLQHVVDSNLAERKKAAEKAEKIIEDELKEFLRWLSMQFITPTIVALKDRGQKIKEKELTRALNRMGNISEREKKVIGSLANSIVNQLLHEPIMQLKAYAVTHQGHLYAEILQNLFSLEVEGQLSRRQKSKEVMKRAKLGLK